MTPLLSSPGSSPRVLPSTLALVSCTMSAVHTIKLVRTNEDTIAGIRIKSLETIIAELFESLNYPENTDSLNTESIRYKTK